MFRKVKYYLYPFLFMFLFFLILPVPGNELRAQPADPEVQAKQLFDEGQYRQALPEFRDLVRLYPSDEELNYYLGASLAEIKIFSEETRQTLEIAKQKFPKSFFYLGQYWHARSDWENALKNYGQFEAGARRKEVKETNVDELKDQCRRQINPFPPAVPENTPDRTSENGILPAGNDTLSVPKVAKIPEGLEDSIIHFQVNALIRYLKIDQFKNESSKEAFAKGWLIEQDLQAKLKELNKLREQYGTAFGEEKKEISGKILKLEQETYQMNQAARDAYLAANTREAAYWEQAGDREVNDFKQKTDQMQDSIQAAAEAKNRKKAEAELPVIISDTTIMNAVDEQPPATDNVVYKIQIGAYSNTPPQWVQRVFKKLSVIRRIDQHVDENGVTVYTVGELSSFDDAVQMQKQIRTEGVKDAFIAAYKNNKRISLQEAKKLTEQ